MTKEFTFRGRKYLWKPKKLAETIFNTITIGAIVGLYAYIFFAVILALVGKYM